MEQLSLTAGKEKENVVQILTDLMEHNREFQIMITVPARAAGEENSLEYVQAKEVPKRDLERDVTNMIHDIGVPAHIRGYQYLREAIQMSVKDMDMLGSITKTLYPKLRKSMKRHRAESSAPFAMRSRLRGTAAGWRRWTRCLDIRLIRERENRPTRSSSR